MALHYQRTFINLEETKLKSCLDGQREGAELCRRSVLRPFKLELQFSASMKWTKHIKAELLKPTCKERNVTHRIWALVCIADSRGG